MEEKLEEPLWRSGKSQEKLSWLFNKSERRENTLKSGSFHLVSHADFIVPDSDWMLKEIQLNGLCHSKTYSKHLGWESLWLIILIPYRRNQCWVSEAHPCNTQKVSKTLGAEFWDCVLPCWQWTVYHCGWSVCFWKRNGAVCKHAKILISVKFSIESKSELVESL